MESSTNRQVNQSLPATVITHKSFLLPRLFQLAFVLLSAVPLLQPALALDELATIDPLAPMDGPGERNIGWQWHYVDSDGKPGYMEKVAGDETTASYERTDGCKWTRPVKGFAPASTWSDCPSTGKADVSFSEGVIWPLTVGAKFIWSIRGTSNLFSRAWKSKRTCEVLPSLRIRTVTGEHDVHKLTCKERWGTRTWWLSPEVGTAIAYRQTTKRGVILQEMTHIIP